ncbi:t-ag D1-type domain-containing protein [Caerostris extrusa]|uniref:T-ag D1-type domain-containing protein n=1 Tax=Caerostris extrusa TaxID=172846 RepID=A0AAV4P191_CAEEX|nr:t-ag D1-type domain-containing protein [Caerostris extrusa]
MDLVDLKILARRRKLLWHPDKHNPNEYSAIYTEAEPDLFCSESTLPPSPGPSNVSDPEQDLDDPLWGKLPLGGSKKELCLSPLELFYATKIAKCIEFCKQKYGPPKEEPVKCHHSSVPDGSKKMNYKNLADFALANEIDDPYELMYVYSHLSSVCERSPSKITNENDPVEHIENAKIFEHTSDKKRVAKNAVESVFAKLLIRSRRESNCQYINRRCKEIGNDIQDNFIVAIS